MKKDVGIFLPVLIEREEMIAIINRIEGADYEVAAEEWKGLGYSVRLSDKTVDWGRNIYVTYNPPGEYGISAEEEYGPDENREFLEAADSFHYYGINYIKPGLVKLVIEQLCEVACEHLDKGWIRNGAGRVCRLVEICRKEQMEPDWNFADY